jgi:acetylglutamate synthase
MYIKKLKIKDLNRGGKATPEPLEIANKVNELVTIVNNLSNNKLDIEELKRMFKEKKIIVKAKNISVSDYTHEGNATTIQIYIENELVYDELVKKEVVNMDDMEGLI